MFDLDNNFDVEARIVALSGCEDKQTSADVSSRDGAFGAFTTCLTRALLDAKNSGEDPLQLELEDLRGRINGKLDEMSCSQRTVPSISNDDIVCLADIIGVNDGIKDEDY